MITVFNTQPDMSKRNKYKSINRKLFKKFDRFWQFGKPVGDFMDENPWTWLVLLVLVCLFLAYRMGSLPFTQRRAMNRADYFEASSSSGSSPTPESKNNNKKTQ